MTTSLFQIYLANFPDQIPRSEFSVDNRSEDERIFQGSAYEETTPQLVGIHKCTIEIGAELGNVRMLFPSEQYEHRQEKFPARCNARSK